MDVTEMSLTGIFSFKEYCLVSSTDGLSKNRLKNKSAQLTKKKKIYDFSKGSW